MNILRTLTTSSVIALSAGPALAELTAADVWADWQGLLSNYGATITTEDQSFAGGTLTVRGVAAGFSLADGDFDISLGDIAFEERGDGTVAVRLAEELPLEIRVTPPDQPAGTIRLTLRQPGADLVASGSPEAMRYDFDYPEMSVSDLDIDAPDVPEDLPLALTMTFEAMRGHIAFAGDDIRSYETASSIGAMNLDMEFADPTGEEGAGAFRLTLANLEQRAEGSVGKIEPDMSAAEMVAAGLRQSGTATHGPLTYEVNVDGPDGSFQMAAAAASGMIDGSFDENGLAYGGSTREITITVAGSAIPLPPMSFRIEETSGRVAVPLVPRPDRQNMDLVMRLRGLEIDDMLWGMIDPAGALPRDPATLVIDLTGEVILTEDFTDPAYAEAGDAPPPGTVEALNVNEIELSAAGASLTGEGSFAFDNSMGIPVPSGVANLMLVGGNGLLDKLQGMGLLPEEQAMGARMMLGLFARPGDGEDTLVSTIEVKEDGSVLANGQRIK